MKDLYLSLLEQGWKMHEIDAIDIFYYIDLLIYKAEKEQSEAKRDLLRQLGY